MVGWIVRGLMIAAGVVTGWFVAKDAPLFGVVQVFVTLAIMALAVAIVAFWPARLGARLSRFLKQR